MNLSRPPLIPRLRSAITWARDGLRDWASPDVNPFLAQARRVDARGLRWPFALLFIALLWACAMVGAHYLAAEVGQRRDFSVDGALLWLGLVWVASFVMARLRDSELLRHEVMKGRFEPIQLMPMSATRRAWLLSAPNSLWALLICATMLPALAWGLGGGLFEPREALLLVILVVASQWSTPLWAPLAWRIQAGAKPEAASKNPLKQVRANSRRAKLADGLVFPPDLAVSARGWGFGTGVMAPFYLSVQFGLTGLVIGGARDYWAGLPFHVRAAGGELWFNWPIFLVRWVGEAQPFYGFSLAPLTLLLPIWLAGGVLRVLRLAAVTGREPFWTPAHFALWQRAQSARSALLFLCVLGALWPSAIEGGSWLTNWFGRLANTPTEALAAWWVIAVAAGALSATAMWRAALELPVGPITLHAQAPRAARLAARGMAWALGCWALTCLLGGRWPLGTLWLQLALPSLAMAAVWIGAQCASHAAQRAPRFANGFVGWHALWFYGGPVGGLLLLVLAGFPISLFKTLYPLSPWTLWLMLRDPAVGGERIFWIACGAHGAIALLVGALAWLLARDRMAVATLLETTDSAELLDELAPTPPVPSAPALPRASGAISLARKPLEAPDAWTSRLLDGLKRFDNPLLLLEMRRALSAIAPRTFALGMIALQLLIASVPAIVFPVVRQLTGIWVGDAFTFFTALLLALPCAATLAATSGAALCYDRDRLDGTLELLFLTPRTAAELATGKVGPFAIRAALVGLLFMPSYLVGVLLLRTAAEPLLNAAYLAAPLWIIAFCARSIAGGHWMALRKRKIGAGGASFGISLLAAFALFVEVGALFGAFFLGALYVIGAALLLAMIYAVEAVWLWRNGLKLLERWRWQGAPGAK